MEAAASQSPPSQVFVLSRDVVKWGIEEIRSRRIHSFFAAYLVLRQQAGQQDTDAVVPNWKALDIYLTVPGGPPGKPYFRPFWDQARNAGQDWMKRHPAGSYNPSSIRPGTAGARVLGIDGKSYNFEENHWEFAREHLLHGSKVPLVALCAFLYRNYGFTTSGVSPHPGGLISIFRDDFVYRPDSDDIEFAYLYDTAIPDRTDWFVPFMDETS